MAGFRIAQEDRGQPAWERVALQFFKENISIANSLLDFYKKDNKEEFARIARELWYDGLFQEEFANLYFQELEPGDDMNLYREVTIFLNNRNFSDELYQILQQLMSREERLDNIEKIKWDKPAYIQALCMEGNYNDALKYADRHIDRWNIVDIMTPCLKVQPVDAINLLDRKIEELLVTERGRDFYELIAQVLKMAADIPTLRQDAENLVNGINSQYSRLTALRDELKTAGWTHL